VLAADINDSYVPAVNSESDSLNDAVRSSVSMPFRRSDV